MIKIINSTLLKRQKHRRSWLPDTSLTPFAAANRSATSSETNRKNPLANVTPAFAAFLNNSIPRFSRPI